MRGTRSPTPTPGTPRTVGLFDPTPLIDGLQADIADALVLTVITRPHLPTFRDNRGPMFHKASHAKAALLPSILPRAAGRSNCRGSSALPERAPTGTRQMHCRERRIKGNSEPRIGNVLRLPPVPIGCFLSQRRAIVMAGNLLQTRMGAVAGLPCTGSFRRTQGPSGAKWRWQGSDSNGGGRRVHTRGSHCGRCGG